MNTKHWDDLIQRYMAGTTTTEETTELQDALKANAELRALYLDYMNLDVALEAKAGAAETVPSVAPVELRETSVPRGWLHWRPLTAAAAGLIIGLFSASMVFAYAVPRVMASTLRKVPLFVEGFEDESMRPLRGFPSAAGRWSGDLSLMRPTQEEVPAAEGKRMARLMPSPKRHYTFAARIVDLADLPMSVDAAWRQIEVTASFHSVYSTKVQRHQIRLAAFSEEPEAVREIWNSPNMFDYVMQHVGRTVPMKSKDHGWQTLQSRMEIPPGARSLVIWLAAIDGDGEGQAAAHYLDDIQVSLILTDFQP